MWRRGLWYNRASYTSRLQAAHLMKWAVLIKSMEILHKVTEGGEWKRQSSKAWRAWYCYWHLFNIGRVLLPVEIIGRADGVSVANIKWCKYENTSSCLQRGMKSIEISKRIVCRILAAPVGEVVISSKYAVCRRAFIPTTLKLVMKSIIIVYKYLHRNPK